MVSSSKAVAIAAPVPYAAGARLRTCSGCGERVEPIRVPLGLRVIEVAGWSTLVLATAAIATTGVGLFGVIILLALASPMLAAPLRAIGERPPLCPACGRAGFE